jgi:flagellar hook-associated protein 2
MSSVSSALNSTSATTTDTTGATTATNTPTFNGTSKYAEDLQNALTRAVQIASMPIKQLNNQKSALTEQLAAYESLQGKVTDVNTAVQSVITALGASSYSATTSNPEAITASITVGALEGSYVVNVTDEGSFSIATSNDGLKKVTDPTSGNIYSGAKFTLSVNHVDTPISLASTSLNGMAAAINKADAGVQATIIDLGSSSSPDYRLSLTSTTTDDVPIDLTASDATSLVTVQTHGAKGSYQVNGQPPDGISSTSRSVTIAPGVNATLLGSGSGTISISRNTSALSSAMNSLVAAYNNAMKELAQYHGQNGGVLEGQSEVWQMESGLRSMLNYTGGSGGATSLIGLGLTFDATGQASFDSSGLSSVSLSDIDSYFGNGLNSGFIQNAENQLKSISDPVRGSLTAAINSVNTRIDNTTDQIDATQERVNVMQNNLTAKLSAADATIAMLEQQANYFTNLFEAMKQDSQNITNG